MTRSIAFRLILAFLAVSLVCTTKCPNSLAVRRPASTATSTGICEVSSQCGSPPVSAACQSGSDSRGKGVAKAASAGEPARG